MSSMRHRTLFVARNTTINVARSILPFSVLKQLFPKIMTGRGKYLSPEAKAVYYFNVFKRFYEMARRTRLPWQDRVLVELGPGDHVLLALGWLMAGARQIVMLDRFKFLDMERVAPSAQAILPMLENAFETEAPPLEKLLARIEWLQVADAEKRLGVGGDTAGLIYSNSVLEHVHDISTVMPTWRHWLDADGGMLHWVDFKSHGMRIEHELDFLTFGDRTWRLMTSNRASINRQRWSEHLECLERAGFELLDLELQHYPEHEVLTFLASNPGRWTTEQLLVNRAFYSCRARQ